MKRSLAITLPLIFSLGLTVPVFAEEVLPPASVTEQTGNLPDTAAVFPADQAAVFPAEQTAVPVADVSAADIPAADVPAVAQAYLANGKEITDDNIREILYGLKSEYPEGRSWTNDDAYFSSAMSLLGKGCAGFAAICTDAVFGNLPVSSTHSDFDAIRVGDIVHMNNSHMFVVLEKHADSIVITEGNYNHSIHWGRKISRSKLENAEFTVRSRYPKTDKLVLSRSACTLKPGELDALFVNIHSHDTEAKKPLWSSSDRRIVDVDSVGWILGVQEGTATITVKVDQLSVSCTVTVTQ